MICSLNIPAILYRTASLNLKRQSVARNLTIIMLTQTGTSWFVNAQTKRIVIRAMPLGINNIPLADLSWSPGKA